jgi:phosphoribosylanthranilate isomerase
MIMQHRVKICGLTRRDDAERAASAGAWALGAIFAEESPRAIEVDQARDLFQGITEYVLRVGVFVNAPVEEITTVAKTCGLDAVQLHGEESPGFCREVKERSQLVVIKALRVSGPDSLKSVVQFDTDFVLLDTYHPGQRGGTGESFDWSLAAGLPEALRSSRIILSGGLRPENIKDAYNTVLPYALDVSSGIETAPGIKDLSRMEQLITQVESCDK